MHSCTKKHRSHTEASQNAQLWTCLLKFSYTALAHASVWMCIVSVCTVFLSSSSGVVFGLVQQASYFIWEAGEEHSVRWMRAGFTACGDITVQSSISPFIWHLPVTTILQSPSSAPAVLFTAEPYVLSHSSKRTAEDLLGCQEFANYSLCLWTPGTLVPVSL